MLELSLDLRLAQKSRLILDGDLTIAVHDLDRDIATDTRIRASKTLPVPPTPSTYPSV